MTTHPLLTTLCGGFLVLTGLLPAVLWSADPVPPTPAPAGAIDQPWTGTVRALLPFIEPSATVRGAADWTFLRREAPAVRPNSLLADPRAATAVAHVREQFRLWHVNGGGMPDWAELFATADGAVASLTGPTPVMGSFVAEVGKTGATALQQGVEKWWEEHPVAPLACGPFMGITIREGVLLGRAGGRWAAATPSLLQAGLDRRDDPVTPPTTPLWAEVSGATMMSTLAALDADGRDPLGLAAWFGPEWRSARPRLSLETARHGDRWRTTTRLRGLADFPLRPPSPAIAGCVPEDALASLVLGIDLEPTAPLTAIDTVIIPALARPLQERGVDPARLRDLLGGDLALVVQAQAPIPAFTLVLSINPGTTDAVRETIASLPLTLTPVAVKDQPHLLAAWDQVSPVGLVQVGLTQDRIIISTGDPTAFFTSTERPVTAALAIDIDLPALARSYLPLLVAMVPSKPIYFDAASPLNGVLSKLGQLPDLHAVIDPAPATILPPLDLDTLQPRPQIQQTWRDGVMHEEDIGPRLLAQLRTDWRRLSGRADLPMQPYLAYYIGADSRYLRLLVLRTAKGWMAITPGLRSIDFFADVAALQPRLAGMVLAAGTEPAALQALDLNDQPSFDRRWLPPPAAVCDHLPRYSLRIEPHAGGWHLIEDGLPALGVPALMVAMMPHLEPRLLPRMHHGMVLRRDGPALTAKHRIAMAALERAHTMMSKRSSTAPPLLTPSAMLAAAQVPLAELASLTGGTAPTAEQVDNLGFWHPSAWPHDHFSWLIPVDPHIFLEVAWWVQSPPQLTVDPRTPQRPATDEERQQVLERWAVQRGPLSEPPPHEPAPVVIDDF